MGITNDFYGMPVSGSGTDIGAVEYQYSAQAEDSQNPTIAISNPTGGSASGNVQVDVSANDNIGVSKVNLLIDGTLIGTDRTAPYQFKWDSLSYANGSNVKIVARAWDDAGNTNSDVVYVTIDNQVATQDTTPPVISAPPNKSREATGQLTSVNLGTASAMDDVDGPVAVTPNNTGPFSVGAHLVIWSATDSAGNTGTATQTIKVTDTTPPTVRAPDDVTVQSTGGWVRGTTR